MFLGFLRFLAAFRLWVRFQNEAKLSLGPFWPYYRRHDFTRNQRNGTMNGTGESPSLRIRANRPANLKSFVV